jgi:hypothetical protein
VEKMNLRELHELTGKVLKERPELSKSLFIDGTYGASPVIAYLDNKEVTVLAKPRLFNKQPEVIVWQAN